MIRGKCPACHGEKVVTGKGTAADPYRIASHNVGLVDDLGGPRPPRFGEAGIVRRQWCAGSLAEPAELYR